MNKKEKVFCQTAPERCSGDDIYLGDYRSGEKVQCPVCGRFTVAGDFVGIHQPNTSMAAKKSIRRTKNETELQEDKCR